MSPQSLSNKQIMAMINFYDGYRGLMKTQLEQHVGRYNQLLDQRDQIQTAVINAEWMEREVMYQNLAKSDLEAFHSDSESTDEDLQNVIHPPPSSQIAVHDDKIPACSESQSPSHMSDTSGSVEFVN